MGWVYRKVAVCDVCEREWLPEQGVYPKQCPNRGCRSRRWNIGGKDGGDKAVESGTGMPVRGEISDRDERGGGVEGVEAVRVSPNRKINTEVHKRACPRCGGELREWGSGTMNCPNCKRNFAKSPQDAR